MVHMPSFKPLEMVSDIEPSRSGLRFLVDGQVAYDVVKSTNMVSVRFGQLSKGAVGVCVLVMMACLGALPVGLKAGIPLLLSLLPLAGVLIGYGLFLTRQRDLKGTKLELQPKRCIIRSGEATQVIEPVSCVIVMNSHRFRDGTIATEGVSELFLEVVGNGAHCFAPIASEGNYAELDRLASAIAPFLQVGINVVNR